MSHYNQGVSLQNNNFLPNNNSSNELPSLDLRHNMATNDSLQMFQPTQIRLKNNLINSTSSHINMMAAGTNDDNSVATGYNNNYD